jgi:hypothetical protein
MQHGMHASPLLALPLPVPLLMGVRVVLLLRSIQSTYPNLTIERSIYWGAVTITTIGALPRGPA